MYLYCDLKKARIEFALLNYQQNYTFCLLSFTDSWYWDYNSILFKTYGTRIELVFKRIRLVFYSRILHKFDLFYVQFESLIKLCRQVHVYTKRINVNYLLFLFTCFFEVFSFLFNDYQIIMTVTIYYILNKKLFYLKTL